MYEPREDSYLLQKAIEDYSRGKNIKKSCDMGTGTGIQAETLLKCSETVYAADINYKALEHINKKRGPEIDSGRLVLIQSDLFENIPETKFDLITFNAPYLPETDDDVKDIELIGGKEGVEVSLEFLRQAKKFLSKNGVILFVASSQSNLKRLEVEAKSLGYKIIARDKKHIFFEDIIIYEVKHAG